MAILIIFLLLQFLYKHGRTKLIACRSYFFFSKKKLRIKRELEGTGAVNRNTHQSSNGSFESSILDQKYCLKVIKTTILALKCSKLLFWVLKCYSPEFWELFMGLEILVCSEKRSVRVLMGF